MPAIDIGGKTYRTLADPIYLEDGRQVKEVWIRPNDTGTPVKVYPESVTPKIYSGTFVSKGKSSWMLNGYIKYTEKSATETKQTEIARQPYTVNLDFSYALSIDAARGLRSNVSNSVYTFPDCTGFIPDSNYHTINYLEFYARYSFDISDFPDVSMRSSPTDTLEDAFSGNPSYNTLLSGFSMYGYVTNSDYTWKRGLTRNEVTITPNNTSFLPHIGGYGTSGLDVNNSMFYSKKNPETGITYSYYGALQIPGLWFSYPRTTYRNFEKNSQSYFYITDLNPPIVHADPL